MEVVRRVQLKLNTVRIPIDARIFVKRNTKSTLMVSAYVSMDTIDKMASASQQNAHKTATTTRLPKLVYASHPTPSTKKHPNASSPQPALNTAP